MVVAVKYLWCKQCALGSFSLQHCSWPWSDVGLCLCVLRFRSCLVTLPDIWGKLEHKPTFKFLAVFKGLQPWLDYLAGDLVAFNIFGVEIQRLLAAQCHNNELKWSVTRKRKLLPPTQIAEQKYESPAAAGGSQVNHCQKPNAHKWSFAVRGCFASAVFPVCVCARVCVHAGVGRGKRGVVAW